MAMSVSDVGSKTDPSVPFCGFEVQAVLGGLDSSRGGLRGPRTPFRETVVMERTTVKVWMMNQLGNRGVKVLLPLFLLLLTQCVYATSGVEARADEPTRKSKAIASNPPAHTSITNTKKKVEGVPLHKVLDLKDLNEDELADLESVLNEQFDPCGKPISFRESLAKKGTCERAIKMGNFIVDLITKGFSKKLIIVYYHKELKRLASRFDFKLDGSPYFGDPKSKNVIVEFTDFQCPHCQAISKPLKDLAKKYKAVLYIKHLPLQIHPAARDAAKASLAAHQQGKFWQVYATFFKNQARLSKDSLRKFVKKSGVDMKRFDKDMKSKALDKLVARDEREADMASVEGTPTIFLNGYMVEMEELEDKLK